MNKLDYELTENCCESIFYSIPIEELLMLLHPGSCFTTVDMTRSVL